MFNKWPILARVVRALRIGDYWIILLAISGVVYLWQTQWNTAPASRVEISVDDHVYGTYSLQQARKIHVHGKLGEAVVHIANGKARFVHSPCKRKYCVHHGWLKNAGHVAMCLPNRVVLTLIGETPLFDTLNY